MRLRSDSALAIASAAHALSPEPPLALVEALAEAVARADELDELCAVLDACARVDVLCWRFTLVSPAVLWLMETELDGACVTAGSPKAAARDRPITGKSAAANAMRALNDMGSLPGWPDADTRRCC